jgi:hypothetical protein
VSLFFEEPRAAADAAADEELHPLKLGRGMTAAI